MKFGGKIPRKYFLSKEDRYFEDSTRVKRVIVPASEKKETHEDIKDVGAVLQWEFLVKGKDIGFGLFFQAPENEIEEVIPVQKYNTSDGTEKDCYKCLCVGKCKISFYCLFVYFIKLLILFCILPEQ